MSAGAGSARSAMSRSPLPLMEAPRISALLASISGLINAWAFHNTSAFATVLSGNLLGMTYRISKQEWLLAASLGITILCFGLGSTTAGLLKAWAQKRAMNYSPILLGIIGALFILVLTLSVWTKISPHALLLVLCYAAGVQGNGFHYDDKSFDSNVASTALTQRAFDYLAQAIVNRGRRAEETAKHGAAIFFSLIFAFSAGALVGFVMDQHISNGLSLLVAAVIVAILTGYAAMAKYPVDPPGENAAA